MDIARVASVGSLLALGVLSGCGRHVATSPAAPTSSTQPASLQPTAGIQDIMAYMIDPAADFLWESVSTSVTSAGVDEKQPRTDDEWNEVRKHAIILTEASNLIRMNGRHVAREGRQLEDHGTEGNLTAAESEQAIAADRATFESFAQALHDVGQSMLEAADDRNPQGILDASDRMDQACEGCHLKFWYPGQKIPLFPQQAPEEK